VGTVIQLTCVACGEVAPAEALTCPSCGPEGTLDVHYDLAAARPDFERDLQDPRLRGVWRYRAILPVRDDGPRAPLQVGPTPLLCVDPARAPGGLRALTIKDDGRLPTASFKDRATCVAVARALESGAEGLLCASTGNAASSLAGFCAAAGLRAVILVPRSAPRAKLAQLLVYGAELFPVEGTYDDAFDLSLPAAERLGLVLRSTGVNPYLAEGKKTGALELAEQFGWNLPEWVAVSVGDGCIVSGLYKGFRDLRDMGLIPQVPKLLGVQAAGSDALTRAWEAGLDAPAQVKAHTVADSISVDRPRDGRKALRAIRESGGRFVRVSDEQILAAMPAIARASGVFSEPAGATSLAGLLQAQADGVIGADTPCVAWVTGSGLKDADSAIRAAGGIPDPIEPTLEALEVALRAR